MSIRDHSSTAAGLGPTSRNSLSQDADNPNQKGTSGTVNLYTGQYQTSFPLASLPGRGGLGVNVSLDYSGNVYWAARQENRFAQASPFGLGFSIGENFVVVDHGSTTDITDDSYKLIVDGTALDLKEVSTDSYMTEKGHPWLITRHKATIKGYSMVIGWKVVTEDGTIYRYGDFIPFDTGWNATCNLLRYNNFVGASVLNDDEIYPYRWNLKLIHDRDSLNWVRFTYTKDERWLNVVDSVTLLPDSSKHTYTGFPYISEIMTPDGAKICLYYSSRSDFDIYLAPNTYEMTAARKCDSLVLIDISGQKVRVQQLRYQYVNSGHLSSLGAPFEKLLLTEVVEKAPTGSLYLPAVRFTYETDPEDVQYCYLQQVESRSGAIQKLQYSTVVDSANFARLDKTVLGSTLGRIYLDHFYAGGNIALHHDSSGSWIVNIWDGYWHCDTVPGDPNRRDHPAISTDNWFAIPVQGNDVNVFRWRSGTWDVDTLTNAIQRGDSIAVYADRDCLLTVSLANNPTTDWPYCCCSKSLAKVAYFRWSDSLWSPFEILADTLPLGSKLSSLSLNSRSVSITTTRIVNDTLPPPPYGCNGAEHSVRTDIAMYDAESSQMLRMCRVDTTSRGNVATSIANLDFAGYWWKNRAILWRHDLTGWDSTALFSIYSPYFFGVYETPDGMFANMGGQEARLGRYSPRSDEDLHYFGEQAVSVTYYDDTAAILGLSRTGVLTLHWMLPGKNSYLREWTGTGWGNDRPITQDHNFGAFNCGFRLYDNYYVYGPPNRYSIQDSLHGLFASKYMGYGTHWDQDRFTSEIEFGFASTPSFFAYTKLNVDSSFLALTSNFHYGESFGKRYVGGLRFDTLYQGWDHFALWAAGNDQFLRCRYRYRKPVGQDTTYVDFSTDLFKLFDTLVVGDAPYLVVSRSDHLAYKGDPNPIRTNYRYYGGLLDQSGYTPRFCKTEVSTPYYASQGSPEGYAVHYF